MSKRAVPLHADLYGENHCLTWSPDMTLLDAMLNNGVEAPHYCRDGECGNCVCVLMGGRVRMAHPEIFGDHGVPGDYIFACQSLPDGVDVRISY